MEARAVVEQESLSPPCGAGISAVCFAVLPTQGYTLGYFLTPLRGCSKLVKGPTELEGSSSLLTVAELRPQQWTAAGMLGAVRES
jgi:hypothetical protein